MASRMIRRQFCLWGCLINLLTQRLDSFLLFRSYFNFS